MTPTTPSDRDRVRNLMMAALDGEISANERNELDRSLAADAALRAEWERLRRVKEVTGTMSFKKPPEEVWEHFWDSVYNRLERGVAWILVSIGTMVLLGFVAWNLIGEIWADAEMPTYLKLSLFAVALGAIILLVSVVRERLFTRRKDPYTEVQR